MYKIVMQRRQGYTDMNDNNNEILLSTSLFYCDNN